MTRRSFCFLFGAGIAGAVVAPSLSFHKGIVISEFVDGYGLATFRSLDAGLMAGHRIIIEFSGHPLFTGIVTKNDGGHVTARSMLDPLAQAVADIPGINQLGAPVVITP